MPVDEAPRPDRITLCAPLDVYRQFRLEWPKISQDQSWSRASLLVLIAHWALETGWGHACHWWNLGNYKHVAGDGRHWTMFRCSEILNGIEVYFDPPHPATHFLAYDTLGDGSLDYLTHLRGRFRPAWPAVIAGDPAQFSHILKLQSYYTAPEAGYTAALVGCYRKLDATFPPDTMPEIVRPDVVADEVTPDEDLTVAEG
jgi:hypothetical protein